MKTSYFIFFILFSVIQNSLAQACDCFKSIDKDYFPSLLCLFGGDESSFCYVEKMAGNLYLEKGTYIFNGDSIFLTINKVEEGFVKKNNRNAVFLANSVISAHSSELSKEGNFVMQGVANDREYDFKTGLIKRKAIIFLNENGYPYLKLKRTKCRPESLMCNICLCP
ncbi:hypothetical protein [Mariniradius sediminis]|uniref:Uncharacterized protein n=1 Tax=Mariniradius sediminis TaxID=2909237 RepID=A0ABS9BT00_9BACT|nr:hypothetical protein [Mariniradius sediminis]MCF1751211.1 hypothetical protein [Mariniradius sediminis]